MIVVGLGTSNQLKKLFIVPFHVGAERDIVLTRPSLGHACDLQLRCFGVLFSASMLMLHTPVLVRILSTGRYA